MQGLAIAETIINTIKAAQSAYAAMAGIFPAPVWGVVAAGVAYAAGLARVDAIRRQEPPALEVGGRVLKGGLAELHPAEVILNKNQAADYQGGGRTLEIYFQINGETVQKLVTALDEEGERMNRMGVR
jgi:hypothetical protein